MLGPSPWPHRDPLPYGLQNLWVMLKFKADVFVSVMNILADFDVLTGDPEWLAERRTYYAHRIDALIGELDALSLKVSRKQANILALHLKKEIDPATMDAWADFVKKTSGELRKRIEDELESKLLFCVSEEFARFWPKMESEETFLGFVFPDASYDFECAAKCLALSQGTACVLHLMRAMEMIVQRMADHLGIQNVEKEWGKLLSDIHGKIEPMPKGDTRDAWSGVHANLYHVKQAWRNKTMHPLNKYTAEEAAEIYAATIAFANHLGDSL